MWKTYTVLSNILLVGMLVTMGIQWWAPYSWWITMPRVTIHDLPAGGNPVIEADMYVSRTFLLHWNLNIRRIDPKPSGYATVACQHQGAVEVHPGHRLPMTIFKCDLAEGTYYGEVVYSWQNWLITRELPVETNTFVVGPAKAL